MGNAPEEYLQTAFELLEPILEDMDFELVDMEYLPEHGRWVLRVFVDRQEGGITLDDCVMLSRELGTILDVKDVFLHEYVLEVSSPGLNRPLKREKDFHWAVGKKVEVQMKQPINGRKRFCGLLKNFENRVLSLDMESGCVPLEWQDVKRARLVYEFDQ